MPIECKKIVDALGADFYNAGLQLNSIGVIKTGLSPQETRLLNALNPKRNDGSVSFENQPGGGCLPVVNFRHLNTSGRYEVRDTATCSAPEMTNPLLEEKFILTQYKESGFHINECGFNTLCSELETFNRIQVNSKVSAGYTGFGGIWRETITANLVKSVDGILSEANDYATEKMVDAVGVNPLYGTDTAQPIKFFTREEQNGATRHFFKEMDRLRRRRGIKGRIRIVTGSDDLADFFKVVCNFVCCSDGIDLSRASLNLGDYEVYYDYNLTEELGENGFLILEPETYAFVPVDSWRNIKRGFGKDKIAHTQYGFFSIHEPSVRKLDKTCVTELENPTMIFDLRVIERDCNGNVHSPRVDLIPSLNYDVWTRPEDADGVTGIYRYYVESYAPVPAPTYEVTFDSDGGSAVASITGVDYGETISAPTPPTKAGFTFEGWFKNSSLTQEWNFSTDVVTANTVLYAKWEEA